MLVAAVFTCKNEIDIVELSLRHVLAEGIDHIYMNDGCSTDGTREVIDSLAAETGQITVLTDNDQYVDQPGWTNRLAAMAGNDGAEWILPNDIDEFAYSVDGKTIVDTLSNLDSSIHKLYMRVYPHKGWNMRFVEPHGMPKVAYRYTPDARVVWGSHEVSQPSNDTGGVWNILDMREMQYRSYEHFVEKAHARQAHLSPQDKANGVGGHHTRLEGWTNEQMAVEWSNLMSVSMIHDPIPSHYRSA